MVRFHCLIYTYPAIPYCTIFKMRSLDFSHLHFFLFSGPCGGTTKKTASNAKSIPTTSTSYPAFHSVQSEYLKSTVHIEPFYRYRVHSDA